MMASYGTPSRCSSMVTESISASPASATICRPGRSHRVIAVVHRDRRFTRQTPAGQFELRAQQSRQLPVDTRWQCPGGAVSVRVLAMSAAVCAQVGLPQLVDLIR